MNHTFLKNLTLILEEDTYALQINDNTNTYTTRYKKDEPSDLMTFRCKIERTRKKSNKMCFILLRDNIVSIQALFTENIELGITRDYIKDVVAKITPESVVDITGRITTTPFDIETTTISNFELRAVKIQVISASEILPIQIYKPDATLDTRLNNRTLDLRPIHNQLIFQLQTQFICNITTYLNKCNFTQIYTPRIMEGAPESGSEVFRFDYFGTTASLAQSPQLHKQMSINSGFGKVFEIGPVFRAESSDSGRHLTQYTSVDIEIEILHNYHEVIRFLHILLKIGFQNSAEFLEKWKKYYPDFIEPIILDTPLILTYKECVDMLQSSKHGCQRPEDINHQDELNLGKVVKEIYGTDLVVIDKYPESIRPFYTFQEEIDGCKLTRSYDFIFRGCEILSGAQRINNYSDLVTSAKRKMDGDVSTINSYLETFKYGSPLHGGGAFGLERVIAQYLCIDNVRNTCLFPRDPNRLNP